MQANTKRVTDMIASNGSGWPMIPRVIHQSWKNKELPAKFKMWQKSWIERNPGWRYKLWTDEDNHQLMITHFPWFNETYFSFPHNIMRADSARYMYMYKHGGVYADLDMECLRPMDELLGGHRAVLAQMGKDATAPNSIPNAFMASEPGHSFWIEVLWYIMALQKRGQETQAVKLTGPDMLKRVLDTYWRPLQLDMLTVLEPWMIYPFDWNTRSEHEELCLSKGKEGFTGDKCKTLFPNAFAITYWEHSWAR
jgi:inositol phosphorylceramide mannosyltransferase catalytic subunit